MAQLFQLGMISTGWSLRYLDKKVYKGRYTHSAEAKTIPPHGKALVDTQISIAVPPSHYGRVAPRSGLGAL